MDVICESCGSENRSAGEFCTECGAFLGWEGSPVAADRAVGRATTREQQIGDHSVSPEPQVTTARASTGTSSDPIPAEDAQATTAVLAPIAEGPACPTCWKINEPGRRFCAKCGTQLVGTQPMRNGPGISKADLRRGKRANRRAFRRSFPAIYQWRRVGLIALAVALVVALAISVGTDPVGWAKSRWYDVRGSLVQVTGVRASVLPTGGKALSASDPSLLVDGTAADWSIRWTTTQPAATCAGGPGTPVIELATTEPVWIRAVDIYPGRGAGHPQGSPQILPHVVGITAVGVGSCKQFQLANSTDRRRLRFDSRQPVSAVRISIDSAFPAPARGQKRLSIREIRLFTRPQ